VIRSSHKHQTSLTDFCCSPMPASQRRSPLNGGGGGAYIPHPAPNAAGNETDNSSMGSALSLLKVRTPRSPWDPLTYPDSDYPCHHLPPPLCYHLIPPRSFMEAISSPVQQLSAARNNIHPNDVLETNVSKGHREAGLSWMEI
jgi:hypothetical protein